MTIIKVLHCSHLSSCPLAGDSEPDAMMSYNNLEMRCWIPDDVSALDAARHRVKFAARVQLLQQGLRHGAVSLQTEHHHAHMSEVRVHILNLISTSEWLN